MDALNRHIGQSVSAKMQIRWFVMVAFNWQVAWMRRVSGFERAPTAARPAGPP
jgi:hypothetical protein